MSERPFKYQEVKDNIEQLDLTTLTGEIRIGTKDVSKNLDQLLMRLENLTGEISDEKPFESLPLKDKQEIARILIAAWESATNYHASIDWGDVVFDTDDEKQKAEKDSQTLANGISTYLSSLRGVENFLSDEDREMVGLKELSFEEWALDESMHPRELTDISDEIDQVREELAKVTDPKLPTYIDPRSEYKEGLNYADYFSKKEEYLKKLHEPSGEGEERKRGVFLQEKYISKISSFIDELNLRTSNIEEGKFDDWKSQIDTSFPRLAALKIAAGGDAPEKEPEILAFLNQLETELSEIQQQELAGLSVRQADHLAQNYLTQIKEKIILLKTKMAEIESAIGVLKAFDQFLDKSETQSKYNVDEERNEIEDAYREAIGLLAKLEETGAEKSIIDERKEKARVAFYKIFRRTMLEKMSVDEVDEVSHEHWHPVYRERMLNRAHNIVEDQTGLKISSVQQFEAKMKDVLEKEGRMVTAGELIEQILIDQGKTISPENRKLLEDYLNLSTEYVARRFLHISWMQHRTVALGMTAGEPGLRKYPPVNRDTNFPLLVVYEYLMNSRLKDRGFGEGTFVSFGNRTEKAIGLKSASEKAELELIDLNNRKKGEVKYEATLTGETWRALDRWARGFLKLKVTHQNFHDNIGNLAGGIQEYLQKKHPEKADAIKKHDVLLAARAWLLLTYHQSSRSPTSSKLPDMIYYASKIHEYSAGYSEQGRADWNTTMIRMLYGRREKDGSIQNNVPLIFGQHPEIDQERAWWRNIFEKEGYDRMKRALARHGFLDTDTSHERVKERLKKDAFISYGFLLRPLLIMQEKAQVGQWKEDFEGGYTREFVKNHGAIVPDSETFAQMPVLATVFLKDKKGKTLFYKEGNNKGAPISLFDVQNEWGEIIYEKVMLQKYENDIGSITSSLAKNGYVFLSEMLKTPDILADLEDPNKASKRKNDIVYASLHLPDFANDVAAGRHKQADGSDVPETDPYYRADRALHNMVIAQMIYTGCIIKILDDKHGWAIKDVENYMSKLSRLDSRAISQETEEAIIVALKAGLDLRARLNRITREANERLEKRFRHT